MDNKERERSGMDKITALNDAIEDTGVAKQVYTMILLWPPIMTALEQSYEALSTSLGTASARDAIREGLLDGLKYARTFDLFGDDDFPMIMVEAMSCAMCKSIGKHGDAYAGVCRLAIGVVLAENGEMHKSSSTILAERQAGTLA